MIKKTTFIFCAIFLFITVFPGLTTARSSVLKYKTVDNKEITINIWMGKNKAYLYLMGNYVFKMKANYLPIRGSDPKNIIELRGNGGRSIYLNRGRKILYFREGSEQMKGVFANVTITPKSNNTIQVKFTQNEGITLNVDVSKNWGAMYFKGNYMFKMSAKYLPIRGSTPDNLIELNGDGGRKIHLNRGRKILYFREGATGKFANLAPR